MSVHSKDPQYEVTFSRLANKNGWLTTVSGDLEQLRTEITDFVGHHLRTAASERETRIYLDALAGCVVYKERTTAFGVWPESVVVRFVLRPLNG